MKTTKYKLHKRLMNVVWISSAITPLSISSVWLKNFQLLRDEEIDNAISNISENIVKTDYGWVEISCTPHKVVFQLAKTGHEKMLADLVVSITNLFENAETQGLGINTYFLYAFENADDWNAIGHTLAPKKIWEESNRSVIIQDNPTYHFGMRNLVIAIENTSPKNERIYRESINVTFSSSRVIEEIQYGLQIGYNHDLTPNKDEDALKLTRLIPSLISEHIHSAVKNDFETHEEIFERILS